MLCLMCPHCRQTVRLPDSAAGRTGPCPACRKPVTVRPPAVEARRPRRLPGVAVMFWLLAIAAACLAGMVGIANTLAPPHFESLTAQVAANRSVLIFGLFAFCFFVMAVAVDRLFSRD